MAEYSQNLPHTHSEKLLPLIDSLFKDTSKHPYDLDVIAVASGPGSFTGLRIGVSTTRAMAQAVDVPTMGINTLEALSRNISVPGVLICPIMDARKQQVYTAVYNYGYTTSENTNLLLKPAAVDIEQLLDFLHQYNEYVLFIGDGALAYKEVLQGSLKERYWELPVPLIYSRASLVAWCAMEKITSGNQPYTYLDLKPNYMRDSEAERQYKRNN